MLDNSVLEKLSDVHGTPLYVFDATALRARVGQIKEIWGDAVKLCYSIKANPFLIPTMVSCVDQLEVCSPGELSICESLAAGAVPHMDLSKIVYSGVSKGDADIDAAIRDKAGIFTAESIHQLELLEAGAARAGVTIPVLLRLNAGSQFGMSKEDLLYLIDHRAEYPHTQVEGIHYFAGTQRKNKEWKKQKEELAMLKDFFAEVKEQHSLTLKKLEYGPGLPVPLFAADDFSDTLRPAKEIAEALQDAATWSDLTVEMGRFFATECGYYITKVMDVKSVGDKNYCIVDGGIHHVNYLGQLMGMKGPVIKMLGQNGCAETVSETAVQKEWAIVGSLCTTNDDLVRSLTAGDLKIGDKLAFCNIGAYSITEGIYLFLSRDLPKVVLWDGEGDGTVLRDFMPSHTINTPAFTNI